MGRRSLKYSVFSMAIMLLSGCSALPTHYSCATPTFSVSDMSSVNEYFYTEGALQKFCPAGTPREFSYQVGEDITLTLRLYGEWLRLKANNSRGQVSIYGEGFIISDVNGFNYAVKVSALKNNTLSLLIDKHISFEKYFSFTDCTCMVLSNK